MHSWLPTVTALLAAAAAIASPVPKFVGCDISKLSIPPALFADPNNASNVLAAPTRREKLMKVVVGYGTQNYTCTNGAAVANGAVATLYDISCFTSNSGLSDLLAPLAVQAEPTFQSTCVKAFSTLMGAQFSVGIHYFKGDFTTPAFEFTDRTKFYGGVAGRVPAPLNANKGKAPLNFGAVPSLRLAEKPGMGSTYSSVYRLSTAGGSPSPTCTEGKKFTIPYAAQYWFYKTV
ncbi:hypothetical protein DRE_02603 [Drechslerella stenobrocha 248]|uniref:Malate dehydrogenase n=1 Tax=Drechslerella stenobrocha 248 TaxID=1043628 RepID=W7HWV2_9PEZI|nr:hypothetical protein DRE_02603 [Drechslerella stenobrocha 248]